MELLSLDKNFQPTKLIENYSSLIWSERFATNGDFELKTYDIANTMAALPLESNIALRDSLVPMTVEIYKIEKPKNDAPILTVTGRTWETCMERRASINQLPTAAVYPDWLQPALSSSDAAYQAIRKVLGDIPRYKYDALLLPLVAPAVDPNDAIPQLNPVMPDDFDVPPAWDSAQTYAIGDAVSYSSTFWVAITTPTVGTAPATPVWAKSEVSIPRGDLYSTVISLIQANYHGIKSSRPGVGGTQVDVEIYRGTDRRSRVVIDARFDQFDDTTYLLSQQGSSNTAYVLASNKNGIVNKTTTTYSGLDRRVLLADVSSESSVDINSRGLIELYKYNATALFDGQIADSVAAGYNKNYFLGDIVRMTGEYNLSNDVRVAEFIRSQDNTGEKAYPTFEVISS